MPDRTPPGPWLRLTAISAVAGSALVVASGALGLGIAHPTLALVALPPLVALRRPHTPPTSTCGRGGPRRSDSMLAEVASGAVVVLAGGAAAHAVHVALALVALAATAAAVGATMRRAPVAAAPWRDYVTLTKPRIMSLLLLTGACGWPWAPAVRRRRAGLSPPWPGWRSRAAAPARSIT